MRRKLLVPLLDLGPELLQGLLHALAPVDGETLAGHGVGMRDRADLLALREEGTEVAQLLTQGQHALARVPRGPQYQ